MNIKVHMLAHHDNNTIRPVFIPDSQAQQVSSTEALLNNTFYYGQNDFATGPDAARIKATTCSVSVGDVIELDSETFYLVLARGFQRMTPTEFKAYRNEVPGGRDRYMVASDIYFMFMRHSAGPQGPDDNIGIVAEAIADFLAARDMGKV